MARIRCSIRDDVDEIKEKARGAAGRVAIANSDAGWSAYAHTAIDQARAR